ncbi:tripartite tricarboxylate transporter substrate binding protein [Roseomonas alkaliterrae]|uniref:Tripartite-type tricarboxylate transporter receptor subunit TctC n=1 Tax=Neoroseomonas alkaliterrae TaxID=1452450 RepID=A0A840Y3A5_9PROT|nr:tripartite tricarboxylate transporter substrate binding protein [Neoroseomonas alkaliterrae]MBB5689122.1 tripartite-type tricarboxylate transporter receptor subunit TctC [Neoroseomonas alkaliterrae]MBR0675283.1 tripartite tricarboxylate transporter substrate binding protein [Neoroseomonas alkaliterrae]
MRTMLTALAAAVMLPVLPAQAQVQMIVNFAAGGPTDIVGRLMQTEMAAALGQPVVVRNVAGAAGTIGTAEAARARPDGQTILFSPVGPVAIQPHYRRNLSYSLQSFEAICQVASSPVVMMTPRNSGLRTVADVIARARREGQGFPFASTGHGTIPHIAMVGLMRLANVELNHIPYRGSGEVMLAFQQGQVQLFTDQTLLIRQYELHPIAFLTETRNPDFPDVPTMREAGYDLVYTIWSGLYAPAGTPEPVLARLEAACDRTMRHPDVVAGMTRVAQPILYRNRADFAAFSRAESEKFRALIEAAGLRAAD